MLGFEHCRMRVDSAINLLTNLRLVTRSNPDSAPISPPEQKALSPAPVSTTTSTSESRSAASYAAVNSSRVFSRKALCRSGRLIVIHAILPRISYRMSSYSIGFPPLDDGDRAYRRGGSALNLQGK